MTGQQARLETGVQEQETEVIPVVRYKPRRLVGETLRTPEDEEFGTVETFVEPGADADNGLLVIDQGDGCGVGTAVHYTHPELVGKNLTAVEMTLCFQAYLH